MEFHLQVWFSIPNVDLLSVLIASCSNAFPHVSSGPFISVLLSRLENLLENTIAVNLLVTGILAQLASYPQPLLRAFLLGTAGQNQPNVRTLYQVSHHPNTHAETFSDISIREFKLLHVRHSKGAGVGARSDRTLHGGQAGLSCPGHAGLEVFARKRSRQEVSRYRTTKVCVAIVSETVLLMAVFHLTAPQSVCSPSKATSSWTLRSPMAP